MRNKLLGMSAIASCVFAVTAANAQDEPAPTGSGNGINVTLNGRPVQFAGTGPQMINGRVLVPLRGIFERLGAYVQWNPGQHEVTANRGQNNVELQIGNPNATVDGRQVTLDVPAQIVDGSTMVPIRFVSESLGAQVRWHEAEQMVIITTGGRAQNIVVAPAVASPAPWHHPEHATEILERNVVIPVTLDDTLSSDGSHRGDRFMATVQAENGQMYGFLPAGTHVTGDVTQVRPRQGNEPGLLEVEFTQINLPDGNSYPIAGSLIDLHSGGISQWHNGMLMAQGQAVQPIHRVWVGEGSGGRMIVQLNGNFERTEPRNVQLDPGTEFGVRLTRSVTIRGGDLRR